MQVRPLSSALIIRKKTCNSGLFFAPDFSDCAERSGFDLLSAPIMTFFFSHTKPITRSFAIIGPLVSIWILCNNGFSSIGLLVAKTCKKTDLLATNNALYRLNYLINKMLFLYIEPNKLMYFPKK
jgi:hypothetical protein